MDVGVITQLIGSLGFPIAVSIALFWYINKTQKEQTEKYQQEQKETREVISNNTLMLNRILEHMIEDEEQHRKENCMNGQ